MSDKPGANATSPAAAVDLPEDDMAIARRIGSGDRASFEQLMRRYNRRLYRLARSALPVVGATR